MLGIAGHTLETWEVCLLLYLMIRHRLPQVTGPVNMTNKDEEEEEGEAGEKETGERGEGRGERRRVEMSGETGKVTQSDLGTCCNTFKKQISCKHFTEKVFLGIHTNFPLI